MTFIDSVFFCCKRSSVYRMGSDTIKTTKIMSNPFNEWKFKAYQKLCNKKYYGKRKIEYETLTSRTYALEAIRTSFISLIIAFCGLDLLSKLSFRFKHCIVIWNGKFYNKSVLQQKWERRAHISNWIFHKS